MKNHESESQPQPGNAYKGVLDRLNIENDKNHEDHTRRDLIEHLCIRSYGKNIMNPQEYQKHRTLQRAMSFFSFSLSVILPASVVVYSIR